MLVYLAGLQRMEEGSWHTPAREPVTGRGRRPLGFVTVLGGQRRRGRAEEPLLQGICGEGLPSPLAPAGGLLKEGILE